MEENKLLLIQSELNAPKDLLNKFGGYHYRSCESILAAVKPLLEKHKCTLTLSDELVMIGTRFYVKALAYFTSGDGAPTCITAYAREEESKKGMDACQITGSASSYARKYALNGLFLIDDAKDSDYTNQGQGATQAPQRTPDGPKQTANAPTKPVGGDMAKMTPAPDCISEAQAKRFFAIYRFAGITDEQAKAYLKEYYGIENSKDIKKADYEGLCVWAKDGQLPTDKF